MCVRACVLAQVGGGGMHPMECFMSVDMRDEQMNEGFQVSQSSAPGACKMSCWIATVLGYSSHPVLIAKNAASLSEIIL